ncbi:MAG: hypothetical protein K9H84_04505 [Bacteroidales bacterium]|nr:hypothetical protein [Bacteroidales bacterium]
MENPEAILIEKEKLSYLIIAIVVILFYWGLNLILGSPEIWWRVVIGSLMIISGIMALTLRTKTYLDYEKGLLLKETRSFYYNHIKEEKLPDMHYLTICPIIATQRMNYYSISSISEEVKCHLNLVFKEGARPRYKTLIRLKKVKAMALAHEISNNTGLPVLDSTSGKPDWVEWFE